MTSTSTISERLERLYQRHADILMERRPVDGDLFAAASRVSRRIHRLSERLHNIRLIQSIQATSP